MDLADAFEAAGLRPVLCSSIREARDAFAAQAIDLVILDVLLPDGDGVELLKEIRTRPGDERRAHFDALERGRCQRSHSRPEDGRQ